MWKISCQVRRFRLHIYVHDNTLSLSYIIYDEVCLIAECVRYALTTASRHSYIYSTSTHTHIKRCFYLRRRGSGIFCICLPCNDFDCAAKPYYLLGDCQILFYNFFRLHFLANRSWPIWFTYYKMLFTHILYFNPIANRI